MLYVAYGVLAKLRLIQYTVRKKKVTSGAQEKKKILQFIMWLICVSAAGLKKIKSNKI